MQPARHLVRQAPTPPATLIRPAASNYGVVVLATTIGAAFLVCQLAIPHLTAFTVEPPRPPSPMPGASRVQQSGRGAADPRDRGGSATVTVVAVQRADRALPEPGSDPEPSSVRGELHDGSGDMLFEEDSGECLCSCCT